ncbi:MAG TPA: ABC transporter permease [Cellulomonas sp.]
MSRHVVLDEPAAGTDVTAGLVAADGPAPGRTGQPRRTVLRATALLVLARLGSAVLVLWAAVTVTFLAVHAMPGDTVSLLLGDNRDDEALRARTIERWDLDHPLWYQYLRYLIRIPTGDLGTSYDLSRPVSELIGDALGPTLQLAFAGALTAVVIAYLATLATSTRLRFLRPVAHLVELVLLSAPPFWIGIVLLLVFSFQLGWFSIIDTGSWQALVLPTLSLGLPIGAYLTQILRDGADRALEQPFAVTARSRGLSAFGVYRRHALRHGSVPVVTVLGLVVGSLIGGAVVVEQVFGRAGLGQLAVNAVTVKDVPLILGVALVATAAFVAASTAVDLVALVIDPRLRSDASA